jgi:hypothetical protein|tara:strand:+ start:351 stop:1043 length:693 start_codon:yes stop_codon:yes gene_type:complete
MSGASRDAWDDYQAELTNDPGYSQWLDDLDSKTHQQQEQEMSLISKTGASEDFKLVTEGTHLARCYLMVDIGLQETPYGDKEKVVLGWEIPEQLTDDGRPLIIYSTYTNSMHEKSNLRRDIESWRGKKLTEDESRAFDLRAVLGHPCQLSIVHNENNNRMYANVQAVIGIPKGLPVAEAINDVICFDLDADGDVSILPDWLQRKVSDRKSAETAEFVEAVAESFDDDIPF